MKQKGAILAKSWIVASQIYKLLILLKNINPKNLNKINGLPERF